MVTPSLEASQKKWTNRRHGSETRVARAGEEGESGGVEGGG